MLNRRNFTAALIAAPLAGCQSPPAARRPDRVRVKVFPGAQNLAHFAALSQGLYVRHGVEVELLFTQNSVELRNGLARGDYDIAHSAVDNAVAMRELAGNDVVIMMGGDNSMNELFVQPGITSVAQLRGQTLIVDAPNTAYALQAKKILKLAGLGPADYAVKQIGGTFQRITAMLEDKRNSASMLNPPFSLQARDAGLRSLGRVSDLLGPYQASGAFAMRSWVGANSSVVERYLAGYIEGLRWALTPSHRAESIRLLETRLNLSGSLAERTYDALADKRHGLTPDARFDAQGFANVLALRAELEGQWGGQPPAQDRYVDLAWYHRALRRVT